MECYCYQRTIQDLSADDTTLYERRYDTPFPGPTIFGTEIFISSNFHTGQEQASSVQPRTHQRFFFSWTQGAVGRKTYSWHIKTTLHCRGLRQKIQRTEAGIPKKGNHFIFPCATGSIKSAEEGPNHHTTNPSRPNSNVVEDISGCLLGEEDDR